MTNPEAKPAANHCLTCSIEAKRQAGTEITQQERNHWSMWGCTCTIEQLRERYDDLERLFDEARGDHPALAAVRALIAKSMDATEILLRNQGATVEV